MGSLALVTVLIVAIAVAVGVPMSRGQRPLSPLWLWTGLAVAFGAIFASDNVPGTTVPVLDGITDWGPKLDGLVLIPAIAGAALLAAATYLGMRSVFMPDRA